MKKTNKWNENGFTLIEIMMAVAIIAVLATVGITQFGNFTADAKNSALKSNVTILRNAIGVMNALERTRCGKTALEFPHPATLQSNDITDCTAATATVACLYSDLINPATNAAYTACGGADANYMALIPLVDRKYVQGAIPDNPWTSPKEVKAGSVRNYVSADVVGAVANTCKNTPVYQSSGVNAANATKCGSAATAFSATDAAGGAPAAGVQGEGGWCYCKYTGQIWANSANSDGLGTGTGVESRL